MLKKLLLLMVICFVCVVLLFVVLTPSPPKPLTTKFSLKVTPDTFPLGAPLLREYMRATISPAANKTRLMTTVLLARGLLPEHPILQREQNSLMRLMGFLPPKKRRTAVPGRFGKWRKSAIALRKKKKKPDPFFPKGKKRLKWFKTVQKTARMFEQALYQTDCYPADKDILGFLSLRSDVGVSSVIFLSLWELRHGQPKSATERLLRLYRTLHKMDTSCSYGWIVAGSFQRLRQKLRAAFGFIIVHKGVSDTLKTSVYKALLAEEQTPERVLQTIATYEAIAAHQEFHAPLFSGTFRKQSFETWPWVSKPTNEKVFEALLHASIQNSIRPARGLSFKKELPMVRFVRKRIRSNPLQRFFSVNGIGYGRVGIFLNRVYQPEKVKRWYQHRCMAGVYRWRYQQILNKQGTSLTDEKPVQPFDGKPISLKDKYHCGAKKIKVGKWRYKRNLSVYNQLSFTLPSLPAPYDVLSTKGKLPTSAPSTRPASLPKQ
ncbi:MAG: hypothetical protein CL920_30995 [Deltaproteobacteria bacterium]|nr:hypothetical protein [Deltaproteobacteria bacterium]